MNFFKSVFSDDPDPEKDPNLPSDPNPNPNPSINGGAWSFGDLLKTVASKSETVIQTYCRDLEEFGSGLKSETALFRDAATRAVKDLPSSIEAAQGSIESVGKAIDGFGSSVWNEILSSRENDDVEIESERDLSSSNRLMSRFEMQVRAIQSDLDTYCRDPEDLGDFGKWRLGFVMEEKREEIERLIGENGVMSEVYGKVVPGAVDDEVFWSRYFYRIDKLKQAEEARADLVRRAVSGEDEENWSWDVDEDDDESSNVGAHIAKINAAKIAEKKIDLSELKDEEQSPEFAMKMQGNDVHGEANVGESKSDNGENVCLDKKGDQSELNSGHVVAKLNEKEGLEGENVESSGVNKSSMPVVDEEEIGWDEIEDLGNDNERKVAIGGSSNRGDVQKRLSTADDEVDLSWDIEDDDEPVKH